LVKIVEMAKPVGWVMEPGRMPLKKLPKVSVEPPEQSSWAKETTVKQRKIYR